MSNYKTPCKFIQIKTDYSYNYNPYLKHWSYFCILQVIESSQALSMVLKCIQWLSFQWENSFSYTMAEEGGVYKGLTSLWREREPTLSEFQLDCSWATPLSRRNEDRKRERTIRRTRHETPLSTAACTSLMIEGEGERKRGGGKLSQASPFSVSPSLHSEGLFFQACCLGLLPLQRRCKEWEKRKDFLNADIFRNSWAPFSHEEHLTTLALSWFSLHVLPWCVC